MPRLCCKCVRKLKAEMTRLGPKPSRRLHYVLDLKQNEIWMDDYDKVYLKQKRKWNGPVRRISPVLVRKMANEDVSEKKKMFKALTNIGMEEHFQGWLNSKEIMKDWAKEDTWEHEDISNK